MSRADLPPTPASSTGMKGRDASDLESLQMSFELPPPAIRSPNASKAAYPLQASEAVKSRRRTSAARENNKPKDQFALPPPPTRSRKIIQVKPREGIASAETPTTTSSSTAPRPTTSGVGAKKKQPSATSAAGRKIARKTAHSLIERRRRSKMNEEFAVLKSLIPACTGEMHKLAILQASIEYVRYLEDCILKLKAQCEPGTAPRTESIGLLSPSGGPRTSNPDRNYPVIADAQLSDVDVDMTSSETQSTSSTPCAGPSRQPSTSPVFLPQDSLRHRNDSYSSASTTTTDYYQHYHYSTSANTSPALGPHGYGQAITSSHSAAGSALTSPALPAQRDLDQEATAALLMLNQIDRRAVSGHTSSGSTTTGRGMSVRDLLST